MFSLLLLLFALFVPSCPDTAYEISKIMIPLRYEVVWESDRFFSKNMLQLHLKDERLGEIADFFCTGSGAVHKSRSGFPKIQKGNIGA